MNVYRKKEEEKLIYNIRSWMKGDRIDGDDGLSSLIP